jgi:TM2 domain-containing membrane protein YozV
MIAHDIRVILEDQTLPDHQLFSDGKYDVMKKFMFYFTIDMIFGLIQIVRVLLSMRFRMTKGLGRMINKFFGKIVIFRMINLVFITILLFSYEGQICLCQQRRSFFNHCYMSGDVHGLDLHDSFTCMPYESHETLIDSFNNFYDVLKQSDKF